MNFFIILITLIFSAFFSGMEIAFISANKFKIELKSRQGILSAKILSYFIKFPSKYLATLIVGNNIAIVIYSIVMAKLLEPLIQNNITTSPFIVFIIQTIIATFIILITSEFLPKAIFRINPNKILNFLTIPFLILYIILYPTVTFLILVISKFLLTRIFRVKFSETKPVFGRIDLDYYLKEVFARTKDKREIEHGVQMFRNALDFANVKVKECMVPRTEIIAVEINEPIDTLKNMFIETGVSKMLVYNDIIDHITGYVDCYNLFKKPENIQSIINPVIIVPETMPANKLLTQFLQQRKNIAVVVDEFGGTSGIMRFL